MLPISGQTVGPIGRESFVDTQGWPGGDNKKNICNPTFTKQYHNIITVG